MAPASSYAAASRDSADRVRLLQERTAVLVADELWESAVLLGSLTSSMSSTLLRSLSSNTSKPTALLSSAYVPPLGPGSHVASLAIYASALRGDQQLKSAENVLRQALQLVNQIRVANQSAGCSNAQKLSNTSDPQRNVNSGNSSINPSAQYLLLTTNIPDLADAQLKHSLARLQHQLGDHRSAIQTLESTAAEFRTCAMLAMLGSLYRRVGAERGTSVYFHDAIKMNPFALEAALALLRMGYSFERVNELVLAGNSEGGGAVGSYGAMPKEEQAWVGALLEAHALALSHKHDKAASLFGRLETTVFPGNTHLLTQIGCMHAQREEPVLAQVAFQRVRSADPFSMASMDVCAGIMRGLGQSAALNSLTRDLVNTDTKRPETWVAMALLCDMRDEKPKALKYVERAIELDPNHLLASQFQGILNLAAGKPEIAVANFYRAYSLGKDLYTYRGLVNSFLALSKVGEALRVAKEALQLMPKDARAVLMVGNVLSMSKDGAPKAIKAYAKVLKLNPASHDAAIAMADLFLMHRRHDPNSDLNSAIQVLNKCLQHHNKDFVHTKLADVYTASRNFSDALTHYHHALALTPTFEPARQGLDRLDAAMRGQADPNDDSDNEMGVAYQGPGAV